MVKNNKPMIINLDVEVKVSLSPSLDEATDEQPIPDDGTNGRVTVEKMDWDDEDFEEAANLSRSSPNTVTKVTVLPLLAY